MTVNEAIFLLGIATGLLMEVKQTLYDKGSEEKYDWLMTAIENRLYRNEPLPPFPG